MEKTLEMILKDDIILAFDKAETEKRIMTDDFRNYRKLIETMLKSFDTYIKIDRAYIDLSNPFTKKIYDLIQKQIEELGIKLRYKLNTEQYRCLSDVKNMLINAISNIDRLQPAQVNETLNKISTMTKDTGKIIGEALKSSLKEIQLSMTLNSDKCIKTIRSELSNIELSDTTKAVVVVLKIECDKVKEDNKTINLITHVDTVVQFQSKDSAKRYVNEELKGMNKLSTQFDVENGKIIFDSMCRKCGKPFDDKNFYKSNSTSSGRMNICKNCLREYVGSDTEKLKEVLKENNLPFVISEWYDIVTHPKAVPNYIGEYFKIIFSLPQYRGMIWKDNDLFNK